MWLVDARKTSLAGVQNSKKNRLAATRLVDDAPHRRWVNPPPPWKKARSAPVDGIRCTKIEQVRFPLYYTIRSYTAFPNSTLLCEPVLGNPTVRFKLFACPRKRASYTRIVYSYVNSALSIWMP